MLATRLADYAGRPDVVVLGLPRGGVPVAYEVARALGAPLDVFAVRKLGVPGREELAMGAIAPGGARVVNDDVLDALGVTAGEFAEVARREETEVRRRENLYRGERPALDLRAKTLVVTDDGLATGASMLVAIRALRAHAPAAIVVAVPVAPVETVALLARYADRIIAARMPEPFGGVGTWYDDFSQTADAQVRALLDDAAARYVV